MKNVSISLISRSDEDFRRATSRKLPPRHVNLDPALHPFEKQREYKRALNSAKITRMLAKPFLGTLDGHTDTPAHLQPHPHSLSHFASAGYDGRVHLWDLSSRKSLCSTPALTRTPAAFLRGLAFTPTGLGLLTCADDAHIRLYASPDPALDPYRDVPRFVLQQSYPVLAKNSSQTGSSGVPGVALSLSHQRQGLSFASGGDCVRIWGAERSVPLRTFSWGSDTVTCVRFNVVDGNVLASSGSDCAVTLYDVRMGSELRRLVLRNKGTCLCWHPLEAFSLAVGSDDGLGYLFDVRYLKEAARTFTGNGGSVMDLDMAPTGERVATAGYDRTVRVYETRSHGSGAKEVYHADRMQRVVAVKFTLDAKFLLSGSMDTAIRLWKAEASAPVRLLKKTESDKVAYSEKLLERYEHFPEVRKIVRGRKMPHHVKSHAVKEVKKKEARERKVERMKAAGAHVKTMPKVNIKKDPIVRIDE